MGVQESVAIVGPVLGLIGLAFGLYQYYISQRWRKSEYAAKMLELLTTDPRLELCCRFLDWSGREFRIPENYLPLAGSQATFRHDWDRLSEAMKHENKKTTFNWLDSLYRDHFDHFFDFLASVNHSISIKLIPVRDVKSLRYWLEQIAEPRFVLDEEKPLVFLPYLEKYGYEGVLELMKRFKVRVPASDHQAVELAGSSNLGVKLLLLESRGDYPIMPTNVGHPCRPEDEGGTRQKGPLANLNGRAMPLHEVMIPALDRGFLFGDAVYEVLRVYQGKAWLLEEHWDRLARSLEAIRIHGVDLKQLRQRMLETIAAGPFADAKVYIQITRGVAPRSHPFPAGATPLEFLFVEEFPDPYLEARKVGATAITLPDFRWGRCDIKSTNLLANVLAAQAAKEQGAIEALLYLPDGTLTEGTHTSFFGVLDGRVLTTPNSNDILPGITRSLMLRLARRAGIEVQEKVLRREDLGRVSELFLTGTTTEVMPIVRVDHHPVGSGQPGPVTHRLQIAYREAVAEFLQQRPDTLADQSI